MLVIPFSLDDENYSVIMCLDQNAITRVQDHDPAVLVTAKIGKPFEKRRLKEIYVTFVSDTDLAEVLRLQETDDGMAVIHFLCRGLCFRPEMGDNNGPPMSLRHLKGQTIQ